MKQLAESLNKLLIRAVRAAEEGSSDAEKMFDRATRAEEALLAGNHKAAARALKEGKA